jgi:hypothetical protein
MYQQVLRSLQFAWLWDLAETHLRNDFSVYALPLCSMALMPLLSTSSASTKQA